MQTPSWCRRREPLSGYVEVRRYVSIDRAHACGLSE